jgi:outer membrane lipoprotein-sorting protein
MKTLFTFFVSILFFNILFLTGSVRADEPLPPPADYSIFSANRKYSATFQVNEKKTTVYKLDTSSKKTNKIKMWEMDGWYRNSYLSDDGENLVIVYDGANLLSLDYKTDEVMLKFYDKGNLLNKVRLNQLIKTPMAENLEKTESHFRWVDTYGMNEKQAFEVNTVEKKKFLFDIKTGLPIEGTLYVPEVNANDPLVPNSTNQVNQSSPVNSPKAKETTRSCQSAFLGIIGFTFLVSFLVSP